MSGPFNRSGDARRSEQIRSIRRYGGTGRRDDESDALAMAFEEVIERGGGGLYIPEGVYPFAGLTLPKVPFYITGDGPLSHLKHEGVGGAHAFDLTGSSASDAGPPRQNYVGNPDRVQPFHFEKLRLSGNPASGRGIHLRNAEKFGQGAAALVSVVIDGHGSDGLYVENADSITMVNARFLNNGGAGVRTFGFANSIAMVGGTLRRNRFGAYLNQVSSSCSFIGVAIHDNQEQGIYALRCEQPMIRNCQFNGNAYKDGGVGMSCISLIGQETKYVESALIDACLFGDNAPGGYDVYTSYVKSAVASNNYIYAVNAAKPSIFRVGQYTEGLLITGTRWTITAGTPSKYSFSSGANTTSRVVLDDSTATDGVARTEANRRSFETHQSSGESFVEGVRVLGDAFNRYELTATGAQKFGDGTVAPALTVGRNASGRYESSGGIEAPTVYVSGQQVLSARKASIANAASGTEVATINSILSALRAHGLIST